MIEVRNAMKKRVFDVSSDRKTIILRNHGCLTIITVNDDLTLRWSHRLIKTP